MSKQCYYGKYRAKVVDVQDIEQRGRIKVLCPKVLGTSKSNWCEPCIPVAYDNGGDFCLPPLGETVWIEFEQGDPNKPIYVGNWFSASKTPILYPDCLDKRIISFKDCKITMTQGNLILEVSGHEFVFNPSTISKLINAINNIGG